MLKFAPGINKKIEQLLLPILKLLYLKFRLSPNQLSFLSFLIGSLSVFFIILEKLEFAFLFLLLALIFDALDGAVARYFKLESKLGERLELIFDRINEAMLFFAIAYIGLASFKIASLALLAILLMTSLRHQSKFDPGFKRIMLFFGYLFSNLQIALEIIFIINLLGFIINLLIIDCQNQIKLDAKNIKI